MLFSNFIHDFTERATAKIDYLFQYQHRIIPVEVKVAEKVQKPVLKSGAGLFCLDKPGNIFLNLRTQIIWEVEYLVLLSVLGNGICNI